MKKSGIKTAIAFLTILCICLPPHGGAAVKADEPVRIFNSFSGYSDSAYEEKLPDGVTVRAEHRKKNLSGYRDSAVRYGDALKIGYNAEPIIPFGKLINSNRLHVSFDIKTTDIDLRNIYIGFYDGRNNSDPNDFDEYKYSMAMVMERGAVSALQSNSTKTGDNDMQQWNRNSTAGVTYIADKWYSVDFVFDFEKNTASYYFDGKLLNTTPAGTRNTRGFKSLLFRCEVPKKDSDGYKGKDAAFIIDNVSIDEYSDSYKTGNLKESCIAPDNHEVYLNCADIIGAPDEENITVKTKDGKAVDFGIAESDNRGVLINIPNLIPGGEYVIDISGIKGEKFGTAGRNDIILKVDGDADCYFYDTFDSYTNAGFLRSWNPTVPEKAELFGEDGCNRAAKITSGGKNAPATGIGHDFAKAITADEFVVEMTLKASGPFYVVFDDISGKSVKALAYRKGGVLGCYTKADENSDPVTYDDFKIDNWKNEYARIKLAVNRKNQTYTVTTSSKSYEFKYNYTLDDICGISIMTTMELGTTIYLDEIYVNAPHTGVYAEFGQVKSIGGAMYYSDGINSQGGQVLRCAEKTDSANGTEYYSVNKQNGTMTVKLDADSGIECDGVKNIRLEIEYLDSGYGWFYAEYETPDGTGKTAAVCMTDSGEVKKTTFIIDDWTKSVMSVVEIKDEEEKLYAACLTLKTYTTVSDGKQSAYDRNYSKYPVVIKSIRINDTDTSAYVRASAESDKTGNIFFEDETPKFNILLNNETEDAKNVKCTAKVYEKDKDGGESQIYSTVFDADIGGNDTKSIKIAVPIEKFGLYSLKTEISGGGVWNASETEFSKCASVSTQNYTMGASAHFTQYGDAESGAKLLKKAGMGLIRDDFRWKEYEKQKGVYALTERQQKLCEAAAEYNLKLLPIVYGNNKLYDSTESDFVSDGAMPNYLEFVKRILSEPEMRAACDMVELWNEPDIKKTRDGRYIEQYAERGEIYGDILKQSAKKVREISHNYKIGAFCLSNLKSEDIKRFMDMALSQLSDENDNKSNAETCFDAIALHPYMWPSVDPERGKQGEDTQDPYDYIGYRTDYIKALVTGGEVYNDVTKTKESPKGITSGTQYGFKVTEPMWYTEYGYSTAKYAKDGLCVGDEYSQAIWLVRGFNQIKINNFDDMVWFYDFADDGDRINEKEYNFGILHSYTNDVPYAAKYAYLALAAFNRMTENAITAKEVYNTDYSFITRYHSYKDDRNSYLLWTSKPTEQTIEYDFGENVRFYDLLGNEISKESVMKGGKYILSGEPYWAVERNAPKYCTSEENKSGLYVIKDGIGMTDAEIPTDGKAFDILADLSGTGRGDRVLFAAAYKDNMLKEIKPYKVKEGASFQIFSNIGFDESDINRIKIMLYDGMTGIKPLCVPLEN